MDDTRVIFVFLNVQFFLCAEAVIAVLLYCRRSQKTIIVGFGRA